MKNLRQFYIDGNWVDPAVIRDFTVINPASEEPVATISLGSAMDVDRAVAAAKRAFESYSETSRDERLALLRRIADIYQSKMDQMAQAISEEIGAPLAIPQSAGASRPCPFSRDREGAGALRVRRTKGLTLMRKEAVGVCGLITPWNWPMNQIVTKVAPAFAAGCTMVLKPSEIAPLSAYLFAQILDEAGVPPGVFNLVNGDGPGVGAAISSHPDIAMVSFTGSTRAGVSVAIAAAPTVKRVTQELGGKSANIILDDADFDKAVKQGAQECFRNTGNPATRPPGCSSLAPRWLRLRRRQRLAADSTKVGDPLSENTAVGPLSNKAQFEKVQRLISQGISEGAKLIAGGLGRPEGLSKGYFAKPTVFSDVSNDMTVAREEIFGPVLCIIPYEDEEDAVRIANDTVYGLSGFVTGGDIERARRVAKRIRSGNVHINGARVDFAGCFGGYKQSGNGREWGESGLEEFLELKAIFGYAAVTK